MSRSKMFRMAGGGLIGATLATFAAGAPMSGRAMAANLAEIAPFAEPSDQPREAGAGTRAAAAATEQPRPAPGQLRRLGGPTPVGGGIRPVGGDIRPVGGDIGVSGGGIRPVGIGSPLQNDRSFAGRLRPHTTAVGVSGFAIEPGWDDPPWGPSDIERPSSSFGAGGSAGWEGVSSAGFGPGLDTSGVADGALGDAIARRYVPAPARPWRVAPRTPGVPAGNTDDAGSDTDWIDPSPIPPLAARPRSDVRPDLRMAVRLSLDHRLPGAIDTVRQAVYREPEAFNAAAGPLFTDPHMLARVDEAISAYRDAPPAGVSPADAAFMVAALEAAAGRGDRAFAAIRHARELGEDRPSGKSLHRVLSRGRVAASDGGATPDPLAPARP